MMKTLLLTFILSVLFITGLNAQQMANYAFSTSTNAVLEDMSSGTTQLIGPSASNIASALTGIGFTFNFMGESYTQFSANSNGQLSLNAIISATGITDAVNNTPLLVPISGSNSILNTGKVHYKIKGTLPNRVLVVEWKDLNIPDPILDNNPPIAEYNATQLQVYLYETSGLIEFKYGTVNNNSVPELLRSTFISSSNTATTVKYIGSNLISAVNSFPVGTYQLNSANTSLLTTRLYSFSPTLPPAPTVTVVNNCNNTSTLTASDYTGTLLWSTMETTPSITVSVAGEYSVTQTVDGFTSLPGTGTAAPRNELVPASVTIAPSANNVCSGTSVTFTATPTNGGTAPTYQWYKNSVAVATTSTYTFTPVNGDAVYVVMTSNFLCASGSPATSATTTMVVNSVVPASVTIAPSANNVCAGTSVTFTPTPVGGGTAPTYQWFKNTVAVATTPTYTYVPVNGDALYVVMTSNAPCVSGSPATSAIVTMIVNPIIPASVTVAAGANDVCPGTSVTFTATPVNGGTAPTYQWYLGTTPVGTNSQTYTYVPSHDDQIKVVMTSNAPCASGSPATSNIVTMTVNPFVPASVTIAPSANNVCAGTSVTFTPTPVNGGTNPTYQWYKNTLPVATTITYTYVPANGDVVYVVMTSKKQCASGNPATSPTITMVVNPIVPASVTIAPSANNVCAGTSVTFTPTPVGGGTTPTYQWFKNTVAVATTPTYTYVPANGDAVYVVMTSNAPCVSGSPATSATTTMVVNPLIPASVTIAPSANNVCAGTSVTFTPTPIGGGTTPTYQWYKNAAAVATTPTYTFTPANGEAVYVVMTSNAPCVSGSPATSATTTMVVNAIVPASVTIAPSANNVCAGTSVTFTPTPVGGGTTPTYQWYKNTVAVATTPTYTYVPVNGDAIYVVMTSNAPCASGSPATSATTTMVVNAVVPASVTIAPSANNVCAGTSVTFTPTPVGGGSAPTYQWYKNTVAVATTPTYTYVPVNGDAVYVVMTSNAPCASGSPATSATTTMVVNAVVPASVTIAPSANNVCAGTSVTFTPTPVGGGTTPTYQWYKNAAAVATTPTYTFTPVNGDAVYVVMTSNAPCVSGSPATSATTTMVVNALVPASVTIAPSANNVCAGTSVTFTPTPAGGGAAPTYQWYKNTVAVATTPTYTYVPVNGDAVYVVMTSNAPCASGSPATSATITMVVNAVVPASVTILPSANNVCTGTSVTFTPTPVGGGAAPTYQWYKNTVAVATTPTYTYVPANGDAVYVVMTSNAPCASGSPATSATTTMVVNPVILASVVLEVNNNPVNAGIPVIFVAYPTGGGTSPTYRWFKNGLVISNIGSEYSYIPTDKDEIYVEMTSNASPCLLGSPATSNTIKMTVSLGTYINHNLSNKISVSAFDKNILVNCMEEAKQIFIYNSLGSLIKSDRNVNGLKKFDMSSAANEYYFVKVVTQNNVYSERVLLK